MTKEEAPMALDCKEKNHVHEEDDSSFISALNLCFSQVQSAALNAAIELNLFDIIAKANGRHMSAAEVASELPTSAQHHGLLAFRLERLLRLLANHSLLTCSYGVNQSGDTSEGERLYGISPIGEFFVSGHCNTSGFVALTSLFQSHPALLDTWPNFKNAIIDEDADIFKKVHGIPFYKYSDTDPKLNNLFNKSMANLSFTVTNRMLEIYKGFEGISTLVDVGGGVGQTLKMILSKYPSIKAINFDLPHVIQNAPPHPGIEHVGGDMFASTLPKGDAIMLKFVCHNWWDENSIKVLKKCYEALPQNGKVIVVEFIMPEKVKSSEDAKFVSGLDNIMFIHDGRERTEKEFQSLCKRSGFSAFKVASRAFSVLGVMEFYK